MLAIITSEFHILKDTQEEVFQDHLLKVPKKSITKKELHSLWLCELALVRILNTVNITQVVFYTLSCYMVNIMVTFRSIHSLDCRLFWYSVLLLTPRLYSVVLKGAATIQFRLFSPISFFYRLTSNHVFQHFQLSKCLAQNRYMLKCTGLLL